MMLESLIAVFVAMAAVAVVEILIPLRARGEWSRRHLVPNLGLTLIGLSLNLGFNFALIAMLAWAHAAGVGLFNAVSAPAWIATAIAVVGFDFSYYVAHRAMHRLPWMWRFHRVHHNDPFVDVTTTIRQHPGDGLIRFAFLVIAGLALGATPAAFAIYRVWSVLNGLGEHANVRVPVWLDTALSLALVTPNMHKPHHSRDVRFTDSNYSNIFSVFDRAFGTFTPSRLGLDVDYGLGGYDDAQSQSLSGLLKLTLADVAQADARASPAQG